MTNTFKTAAVCAALTVGAFAAGAAKADTVVTTFLTLVGAPTQQTTATANAAFNPTSPMLSVQIAGKTCSLVSSAQAIGPVGCNYALTVGPDGSITGVLAAGNAGCTPTPQVAAACK